MKTHAWLLVLLPAVAAQAQSPSHEHHAARDARPAPGEHISINDNRSAAGVLKDGVLTLALEVREGDWRPEGDERPGLVVRAFAEEGKEAQIPAPLVRVPKGTVIHAFVRNSLRDSTLVVHGLSGFGAASGQADTIRIRPGERRELRFVAGAPGTYHYWASAGGTRGLEREGIDSQLGGAFIVDDVGVRPRPEERVMVIGLWRRDPGVAGQVGRYDVLRFVINGRSWPHTERLAYTVGDSVRFRVINLSDAVHPMHLHGFYFNVESRGTGHTDEIFDPAGSRHLVVTERLAPGQTTSFTWVPERSGNWMFHCHDNRHVLRNAPLDGTRLPPEQATHAANHATGMMGGLVMGVEVRPRPGDSTEPALHTDRRRLRLVARPDSGGTDDEPAYGYVLQDGKVSSPPNGPLLPGPVIVLRRGEPVGITVVNELREPTSVHWHGIELDSYFDGVGDFSGHPGHIASTIAPRDSFEARFTPPRAGTFMYHPHADEVRQQQAGLSGALIVLGPGERYDPERDIVLLLSVPRRNAESGVVLLNGSSNPAAREWRAGVKYRLRLINIHTFRPGMIARLERDSVPLTWRAIAKDGMDLPPDQATVRPSRQPIGNGEAYDFEFTPDAPGDLRLVVTTGAGGKLVEMPIRVR